MTTTTKPKTKIKARSPYRVGDMFPVHFGYTVLDPSGDEVAFAKDQEQAEWLAERLWLADRYLTVGRRRK